MPSDNAILGSEVFDEFMRALHVMKIYSVITTHNVSPGIYLRKATFYVLKTTVWKFPGAPYSEYETIIAEEYLAVVDNRNGIRRIAIEFYPLGERPNLRRRCVTIN